MFNKEMGKGIKGIDENTKQQLLNYNYPGNLRELRNIIERLIVLSNGSILKGEIINYNKNILNQSENKSNEQNFTTYKEAKRNFEIKYITDVLKKCNNNITHAAKFMNISRRQLFNKITEYNLNDYSNFR